MIEACYEGTNFVIRPIVTEVGYHNASDLESHMRRAMSDTKCDCVILDLEQVEEIGSCFIGTLINIYRILSRTNTRLSITNLSPQVMRTVRLLKVASILPVTETTSIPDC